MRLQMAQDETARLQSETRYDLFKRINKKNLNKGGRHLKQSDQPPGD